MKRGATRNRDFDYAGRSRAPSSPLGNAAYAKLWPIVDGAVKDALKNHSDYLTPKGQVSARTSIVKRVTGTVIGFAAQAAKGRATNPAETAPAVLSSEPTSASLRVDEGVGVLASAPATHCRIGKVRLKRRTRYRAAGQFDLTTNALRGFPPVLLANVSVRP